MIRPIFNVFSNITVRLKINEMSTAAALHESLLALVHHQPVEVLEPAFLPGPSGLPASDCSLSKKVSACSTIAKKRPQGPDLSVPPRKKKPTSDTVIDLNRLPETKYYFEKGLRKVQPYYFTWTTYAKGRWVGRTIEEVFRDEFWAVNEEVTEARLKADPSNVFVNGVRVDIKHKIKSQLNFLIRPIFVLVICTLQTTTTSRITCTVTKCRSLTSQSST
jgi:hypothetical protein